MKPLFFYQNKDNISIYRGNRLQIGSNFINEINDDSKIIYSTNISKNNLSYFSGMTEIIPEEFKVNGNYWNNEIKYFYGDTSFDLIIPNGIKSSFNLFSVMSLRDKENYEGYYWIGKIYNNFGKNLIFDFGVNGGEIRKSSKTPITELFVMGGLETNELKKNFSFIGMPIGGVYSDKFVMTTGVVQHTFTPRISIVGKYNILTANSSLNSSFSFFEDNGEIWKKGMVLE